MKRFMTVLWIMCLVCLLIPAMAEDVSDISGTDWVSPEDGYIAKWENPWRGNPAYLVLCPVDPEGNPVYVDHTDITCSISNSATGYAITLEYELYPEEEPESFTYMMPVAMPVGRFQELIGQMSSKDKHRMTAYKRFSLEGISESDADELLTYFPALATEDMYILVSVVPGNGVVPSSAMKNIEEMLGKYGYTEEDYEKDLSYVAVNPSYLLNPHAKKYINYNFLEAVSAPLLTRSRVLQLAALIDIINNDIVVHHIRPEGEPVSVEKLIRESYEVDGTTFSVILNDLRSWTESVSKVKVELTVIPQESAAENSPEGPEKDADMAEAESNYNLGLQFYNGDGKPQSYEKAAEYYRLAADQGLAEAQYNLGVMYAKGQGVEQSYEKALEYYQLAADQGYVEAQYNLGFMYYNGLSVEQSYEKAVEYYQMAADQGLAQAQFNLGVMYTNGRGVEQSYEKALKYYQLAADQGYADAQYNLGVMYENGQGVEQSYEKAVEYYQMAADQGYADAQYNLGVMYYNGQGVKQSYEKAAVCWQMAADQGYADAQYNLGVMYAEGQGVEQSYEKALEYWQLAVNQGHVQAQHQLGFMYYDGQGVEQSYEKAVEYWKLAADQGYVEAQYILGIMYANGLGVEQSYEKAVEYIQMAADQGYEAAREALKKLQGK